MMGAMGDEGGGGVMWEVMYIPPDEIVDPVRVELLFGHGFRGSCPCMGSKSATWGEMFPLGVMRLVEEWVEEGEGVS